MTASLASLIRERDGDVARLRRERDPLLAGRAALASDASDSEFYEGIAKLLEFGIRLAFTNDGRDFRE